MSKLLLKMAVEITSPTNWDLLSIATIIKGIWYSLLALYKGKTNLMSNNLVSKQCHLFQEGRLLSIVMKIEVIDSLLLSWIMVCPLINQKHSFLPCYHSTFSPQTVQHWQWISAMFMPIEVKPLHSSVLLVF